MHRLSHTACPKVSVKALGFLVKPYHMERNICEIKTIYNRVKLAFVPIFFTVNSVGGGWESGCMLPGAYGYLALYVGKLCCEYCDASLVSETLRYNRPTKSYRSIHQ